MGTIIIIVISLIYTRAKLMQKSKINIQAMCVCGGERVVMVSDSYHISPN